MLSSIVVFVVLSAWTPWISKQKAAQMFSRAFISGSVNTLRTCSLQCSYCGLSEPKKVPFGYEATIESSCNGAKKSLFLSLIGTVHTLQ